MLRTNGPQQALVNAQAVLTPEAGATPSEDDVLFALLDTERAVRLVADAALRAELDTARLALTGLYAEHLLVENPGFGDGVSDDPNEPDPLIPGGGIGLTRAERIVRRSHWSAPVMELGQPLTPEQLRAFNAQSDDGEQ